jgi:hypothetical protein
MGWSHGWNRLEPLVFLAGTGWNRLETLYLRKDLIY